MQYWIEHTYKGYMASALPGKDMPKEAFETFSYAIGAFGYLVSLNERISLSEWAKRIKSSFANSPRIERVLASINVAMGKPALSENPKSRKDNETLAWESVNTKAKLKKRLLEARSVLTDHARSLFKKKTIDYARRMMISDNGMYALEWRVRTYPDKPESYDNQQTNRGTVVIEMNHAAGRLRENPRSSKIHDIEEETPIAPWVAADTVHERAVVWLHDHGHEKAATSLYSRRNEVADYLAEQIQRVYARNERFRKQMKRIKTIDKVHAFMEHWLAGWLKDNAPYILKLLPGGYGWSVRL